MEKKLATKDFFACCGKKGIQDIAEITSARAYEFLSKIKDERGANVANKYRKNLLAAWNWGSDFFEGFPQVAPPFLKVKPFPVKHGERYVPPESDVIKVFQQAEGQDLVMLLTLYFTGGRRSEIFRLTWNDVDLQKEKIRLTDNKSGNGMERMRWLRMHPELVKALKWWRDARPCKVDNVFMQLQNDTFLGQPFTQRIHFMGRLCREALRLSRHPAQECGHHIREFRSECRPGSYGTLSGDYDGPLYEERGAVHGPERNSFGSGRQRPAASHRTVFFFVSGISRSTSGAAGSTSITLRN